MSKKSLKYFMREQKDEIITAKAPDSFKDENGNIPDIQIKVLSAERFEEIRKNCTTRKMVYDKKRPLLNGNEAVYETITDNDAVIKNVLVEALVDPDLKDPELLAFYGVHAAVDVVRKVFRTAGEYTQIIDVVYKALGFFRDEDNETNDVEEAKN